MTSFSGAGGSKSYLSIEESLMSHLLDLDSVETYGDTRVRAARKSLVTLVQNLLAELESRADFQR